MRLRLPVALPVVLLVALLCPPPAGAQASRDPVIQSVVREVLTRLRGVTPPGAAMNAPRVFRARIRTAVMRRVSLPSSIPAHLSK